MGGAYIHKYHCVIFNTKEKQTHFKWYPAIPIKNNNQHWGIYEKTISTDIAQY
jgi:hypothetical protein